MLLQFIKSRATSFYVLAMKCLHVSAYSRATTLSNAVSSLASTGLSLTKVDEREKQAALEEEQARLKALKVSKCGFSLWKNK